MFNGNLVLRLLKEQRKQVGDMVGFVFGQSSHISMTYFKDRTYIDSRYLERLSEYFDMPIGDWFLTDDELSQKQSTLDVHHIRNSTVNINSSPDVMMGVINNQKEMLDQQGEQIAWLRKQVEVLQSQNK